ncbi:MAG: alkaline phosphatase D family protein [Solirubrobacteraceae bacterium]
MRDHLAPRTLTRATDFTGKLRLGGLPAGREVFYRVTLEDASFAGPRSTPLVGSFRTAPDDRRDVSFVWSGDLGGQGFGINPAVGGYRIFAAMGALEPDFFLCSGDLVYADDPLPRQIGLADGRVWHNEVTEAKEKVAETLDEFRGQYAYNWHDGHLREFARRVPSIVQWDDHEVRDNWYPGQVLTDDDRYSERAVDVLAARGRRAFAEWTPIGTPRVYRRIPRGPLLDVFVLDLRTYRDPNGPGRYADPARGLLGAEQRTWLKRELAASTATWKVLAIDLPLGLVLNDDGEAIAQGEPGAPLGRELEFAEILRFALASDIGGLVFLTADVHYAAAHHYDPTRAAIGDFAPFWEFVAGPLNAGSFGPNALDPTFGPEAVFTAASQRPGASPADGHQYFGHVAVDGATEAMTVSLRDLDGRVLFAKTLAAVSGASRTAP